VGGTIPGKHFRRVGPVVVLRYFDLLGAAFFRSLTKFGSSGRWIDKLLSEARFDEYRRRAGLPLLTQKKRPQHGV
jgi:hypothetical protein